MRDAAEQAREQLAPTRAAQHDELSVEGVRLPENRLGDPVDGRVADDATGGEAGHSQLERRRLGDEGGLVAALKRAPVVSRHLAQPQMQHPNLGNPFGRDTVDEAEYLLALAHVIDRRQDPREHRTLTRPSSVDADSQHQFNGRSA